MNERETIYRIASRAGYGPVTEEQVAEAIERSNTIRTRADEDKISRKVTEGTSSITEELALELIVYKDIRVLNAWHKRRKPPRKNGRQG